MLPPSSSSSCRAPPARLSLLPLRCTATQRCNEVCFWCQQAANTRCVNSTVGSAGCLQDASAVSASQDPSHTCRVPPRPEAFVLGCGSTANWVLENHWMQLTGLLCACVCVCSGGLRRLTGKQPVQHAVQTVSNVPNGQKYSTQAAGSPARALSFRSLALARLRYMTTRAACTKRCTTCTRLRQALPSLSSSHCGLKPSRPV